MKITFNKSELLPAFAAAASAVNNRSQQEIVKNVLVRVAETSIFTGTDNEITVCYEIDAGLDRGSMAGEFLLPAAKTLQILKECGDSIEIDVTGDKVVITSGGASWTLATSDPQDFPPVKHSEEGDPVIVTARVFASALRCLGFCCDDGGSRFCLQGVHIDRDGDRIALVATDTRRMGILSMPADGLPDKLAITIPEKACDLIGSMIGDEDKASIWITDNTLMVESGPVTIITQLMQGKFPPWEKVVPSRKGMQSLTIPGPQLLAAVRQCQLMADEENSGTTIDIRENEIRLSAESGVGSGQVTVPVSDAEPCIIKVSGKYLSDYLRMCPTSVEMAYADPDAAMLFESAERFRYVLMPLAKEA